MLDYTLPTDVVGVHVERGGTKQAPELDIRVARRLPPAAYVLLAVSVACASMYDISMQLLVRTPCRCWCAPRFQLWRQMLLALYSVAARLAARRRTLLIAIRLRSMYSLG